MKTILNLIAAGSFLSIVAIIIGFMLLPSQTFIEYTGDGVVIDDASIPQFVSTTKVNHKIMVEWNDVLYCNGDQIVIPTVRRVVEVGENKSSAWSTGLSLDSYRGTECYLEWNACPMLFGFIKGKCDTGRTKEFILK